MKCKVAMYSLEWSFTNFEFIALKKMEKKNYVAFIDHRRFVRLLVQNDTQHCGRLQVLKFALLDERFLMSCTKSLPRTTFSIPLKAKLPEKGKERYHLKYIVNVNICMHIKKLKSS